LTVEIHTAKTVHLDRDRSINFVKGKQKLSREKAEAAINANITTKPKTEK